MRTNGREGDAVPDQSKMDPQDLPHYPQSSYLTSDVKKEWKDHLPPRGVAREAYRGVYEVLSNLSMS